MLRMLVSLPRSAHRSVEWDKTRRAYVVLQWERWLEVFAIYGYWQQLFYNADSYCAARPSCFSTARGTEGARNKSSAGSCTSLLSPDSGESEVEDREESRGTRNDLCSLRFSSRQSCCSDVVTNGAQALRYSRMSDPNRYLDNSIDSAWGRSCKDTRILWVQLIWR